MHQKRQRRFVLPNVGTDRALAVASERGSRDSEKERAMTTTTDFYRRLSQRRAALKRRTNFLERLLWRWM